MTSPPKRISPWRGRSSPLIVASSVDLPAPLGPTMQVIPPSGHVEGDLLEDVAAAVAGGDAADAEQRLGPAELLRRRRTTGVGR